MLRRAAGRGTADRTAKAAGVSAAATPARLAATASATTSSAGFALSGMLPYLSASKFSGRVSATTVSRVRDRRGSSAVPGAGVLLLRPRTSTRQLFPQPRWPARRGLLAQVQRRKEVFGSGHFLPAFCTTIGETT
jgi:hypothetical protein